MCDVFVWLGVFGENLLMCGIIEYDVCFGDVVMLGGVVF